MAYIIATIVGMVLGYKLGFKLGFEQADDDWVETMEDNGWKRVTVEEGPQATDSRTLLKKMYGDHWYRHREDT